MHIVLSAHFDLARPVMSINMDHSHLRGLVDNFAGVFVSYQASRRTGVPVFFTNFEELEFDGADSVAKSLDKDTLVIVVDTNQDAQGQPAYIGNAYGIETTALKKKFQDRIFFMDGMYEEFEDETIIYGGKYGLKTLYFGIPIPNPHETQDDPFPIPGSYHHDNNQIALSEIDTATDLLVELINHLKA